MKIIFATQNPGKIIEMKKILDGFEVVGMEDIGVMEEVEEDRNTLEGNALKKARFVWEKTKEWVVADDTGLFIESLNGAPGVKSARWAGEGASGNDLMNLALSKLKGKENRNAYFESVVVLISPKGEKNIFRGRANGKIAKEPSGVPLPKLPYDVLFIPDGHNVSFAEMTREEKNQISHRGLAFQKLRKFLEKN